MPKIKLKLLSKTELSPKVYLLTLSTESKITYSPGQFLSLIIEPGVSRPYSISYVGSEPPFFDKDLIENYKESIDSVSKFTFISLMISTKPGGTASKFIDQITVESEIEAVGPGGRFALKNNQNRKVFIATGTGLAPFVVMINSLIEQNPEIKIDLFFGCWDLSGNFVNKFFENLHGKATNFRIFTVAESLGSELPNKFLKEGRVTSIVPEVIESLEDCDFYLCGHPAMVTAMEEALLNNQVKSENIIMEKFGKPIQNSVS